LTGTPLPFTLEGMDKVAEELNGIKKVLEKMLDAMPKPESRVANVLKTVVLIVGALGILHTADVIRRWLIGG